MKILQVITSLQTGGAEKIVVDLVPRLRKRGHVVDVAVFNGVETPLMNQLRQDVPEVKIYKFGKSVYNPLYIFKLVRLMRKYDIIHTHNSSPQLFAAIASLFCSVKLCSTEHTTSNRKRGWKWYRPIESWMYSRYDHVICISKIAEEKLREYMGGKWLGEDSSYYHRISTINNGVDVSRFATAQPLKELQNEETFKVVMVAGFRDAKDQDTLIKAMGLLPNNYVLWLIGDGERRQQLEHLIASLRISDRVKLLGLRTDIPNILRSADVVCMSSHWEGLSLSNIEGMAVGKPFVASDVNGLREVTDGYGILFPHGDVQALADIIKKLHDDKKYNEKVAEACYQRALQFDIEKMVEGYDRVYLSL